MNDKRITAKLLSGPRFILIDNVRSRLDSAALSAALTSLNWEDRILGQSRTVSLPIDCVWLATGNNPALSLEVARRTVSIRLDSGLERPWERTEFKHPNLRGWAVQHRGELIWAALMLVQAWVVAGMPKGKQTLGNYEAWAGVIGGILDVVGVKGFLGNQDRVYLEAEQEISSWVLFCGAWWDEYRNRPVGADILFALCTSQQLLPEIWRGRPEHSGRTRFGIALRRMRGRVLGGFRINALGADPHTKAQQYELEVLAQPSAAPATVPPSARRRVSL